MDIDQGNCGVMPRLRQTYHIGGAGENNRFGCFGLKDEKLDGTKTQRVQDAKLEDQEKHAKTKVENKRATRLPKKVRLWSL